MTRNRGKIKLEDGKHASHLEVEMLYVIKINGFLDGMVREHKFHPTRKWMLDFAWPDKKIGIEVQGGIWSGKFGGHTSGTGRMRDMEKSNAATILGWKVIEVSSAHIKDGQAAAWIAAVMKLYA